MGGSDHVDYEDGCTDGCTMCRAQARHLSCHPNPNPNPNPNPSPTCRATAASKSSHSQHGLKMARWKADG